MNKLVDVIFSPQPDWTNANQQALDELFGANTGRYPSKARDAVKLRAPKMTGGEGVSFAAYIHPSNPDSGPYGGMSFVIFPIEEGPCLIGLVVGSQGLSPDEHILSRPGHARKVAAICHWLNHKYGKGKLIAWSKQDPTRIDQNIPDHVRNIFSQYNSAFTRYGKVLYGIFVPPTDNRAATVDALTAFLDLMFAERGFQPLTSFQKQSDQIRSDYLQFILPSITEDEIKYLLKQKRFIVLEGPPGTGKTRLALKLLESHYHHKGFSIQFHPNTTYETFVGGLSPLQSNSGMGFYFAPKHGYLMEAVIKALQDPNSNYLLHIDEINRADLAKVLGEAIFLFESRDGGQRQVNLPYDFGGLIGRSLQLPDNLHILGTMNSSDRSIAILDIAIRRRFAFVKLWPQISVVQTLGCEIMQSAFRDLLSIFIEYANEESLNLMPGHAYFLEDDNNMAVKSLQTNLYPLLEEYLAQGYVASFSEHILAYMQWLKSLS